MSTRRVKPLDASQATISHVFTKAKTLVAATEDHEKHVPDVKKLVSTDPLVQAFYDQLGPKEVIAHSIAVEKLGTSYDVTRTHGYLRWTKSRSA
jgi:hypothetical protein